MTKAAPAGREAMHGKQMRNSLCACGSELKYKKCCGSAAAPVAPPRASRQQAQDHFLRGMQHLRAGQIPSAKAMFLAAIQLDETHFEAFHALGAALMQAGQFAQAAGILSRALALRPDAAEAHRDQAVAYDRLNLHEEAIPAYRRAAELAPERADVQHRLGELLVLYSRYEEASRCFDLAADAQPDSTVARIWRSDARLLQGDAAGAEQWARKAAALDPASDAAHGTLGGLLYTQGRFEDAAACFDTALRLNPRAARCWDGLAHCRKYGAGDDSVLDRLRATLDRGDLDDAARMTLHFAAGKIHDDRGEAARAMAQFDSGNALRARDLAFDRAAFEKLVAGAIARFTPDFIARQAALSTPDETPLFIVGMFRSGTTLAEQILSSHPHVRAGGELTVWTPADLESGAAGEFDPARVRAAMAKYLSVLHGLGPSAARVTDKMPFNVFRLGAIHALMPKARIIHCRRHPVDTCLSIYTTLFRSRVGFAARKEDLVFVYRLYLRVMAHWREVLPAGVLTEVSYEQLVCDREAETRRLVAFAGLDWDDRCLRPEQNDRSIGTSSAWQARQPVYATSVDRWRRYEPWLGALGALL